MFHHWQKMLGVLVYRGQVSFPDPHYKPTLNDFLVEDRMTPNTVYVRVSDKKIPVFHAHNQAHAERLKSDHPLQANHSYC